MAEEGLKSCLPDRLSTFTAREEEIQKIISFLKDEETGVVSLHGGPGVGKTAIAEEVSNRLSEDHNLTVIFSDLNTASNVDEVILQLCRDVGVNPENDPKSSLILAIKNIKTKFIFVMDDIDKLLETKSDFYTLLRFLRKNSNQRCKIFTTSRMTFTVPNVLTKDVQAQEMDEESCSRLLREICQVQDDTFLKHLAQLCGHIPLAMCIAASRVHDFENPNELLTHIETQPMNTLENPQSDQYIKKAIDISYEKLSYEEKESLVRLTVFEGNFDINAAKAVIEKSDLETSNSLKKLTSHSLIKQSRNHRFSIHLLIKRFLEDDTNSDTTKAKARKLMVEYYLKLCHNLTQSSYSEDGFKENREKLKMEAHNIESVLKICSKKESNADIQDCVAASKIYTTSSRFFFNIVRSIITENLVENFLVHCAKLAVERNERTIKLNFDCLLADRQGRKTNWSSDEYFAKMKAIEEEFTAQSNGLKQDKLLCAHYYYQYGRCLFNKSKDKPVNLLSAREFLTKSLKIRRELNQTSLEKADVIISLLLLGNVCKKHPCTQFSSTEEQRNKCNRDPEEYFKEAIELSKRNLGKHELTSACYKALGDLYFTRRKMTDALRNYKTAKEMREDLELDASEQHVFLLHNLGQCLSYNEDKNEALQVLKNAAEIAEKLSEDDVPSTAKGKVYKSLALMYNAFHDKTKAEEYSRKALEINEKLNKTVLQQIDVEKLEKLTDLFSSISAWRERK